MNDFLKVRGSSSLEIVGDVGEWAAGLGTFLLQAKQTFEDRRVGLPLRAQLQVFIHALVSEVEVLVAPVGGGKLRVGQQLANQFLFATELSWLIHGVDVVENGTHRNRRQISHEVLVAVRDSFSKLELASWCEP